MDTFDQRGCDVPGTCHSQLAPVYGGLRQGQADITFFFLFCSLTQRWVDTDSQHVMRTCEANQ